MTCDLWREKLNAYVDGSCSPDEVAAVDEHLRDCSSCAAEALGKMQMKRATRAAAALRYAPSPEFRARMEKSITRKYRKPMFTFRWMEGLAAVAVVLIAVSMTLWVRHSEREQALAQLVDLHVATVASANPVDVVSTDRHTVKPWFQGRLPFTFNLPELGNSPFKLLGGKLMYFNHDPGAELLFETGKHEISVFIVEDRTAVVGGATRVKGFSVESWSENGLRYVVVSDAGSSDVHALSELLREAGHQ